jgi:hypothetical protein
LNTHVTRRPVLSAAFRAQLQAEFAPEVAQLGGLLQRDLSHWSKAIHNAGEPISDPVAAGLGTAKTFIPKFQTPQTQGQAVRGELPRRIHDSPEHAMTKTPV